MGCEALGQGRLPATARDRRPSADGAFVEPSTENMTFRPVTRTVERRRDLIATCGAGRRPILIEPIPLCPMTRR